MKKGLITIHHMRAYQASQPPGFFDMELRVQWFLTKGNPVSRLEAELRIQASDFVAGLSDDFESFVEVVRRMHPRSIAMAKSVFTRADVAAELLRQQYLQQASTDFDVVVWH